MRCFVTRFVALVGALALVVAACGDGDAGPAEALPEVEPGTVEVEVETEIPYHEGDDRFERRSGLVDVAAPTTEGPWPVVVAFHGDPRYVSKEMVRQIGTKVAEHGRVVFMPAWGHTDGSWSRDVPLRTEWEALTDEIACAVAYANVHAADHGGDPDHITVYGFSAGGNAALMAGLGDSQPLDACAVDASRVTPNAVVSADADALLGGGWDSQLAEDPEAFYALTPWRDLDPEAHPFPVHVLATDTAVGPYDRPIPDDPDALFGHRHVDVDLEAELDALGLIEDGGFSILDGNVWTHDTLADAGYDAHWLLLPDSTHDLLSPEARELLVDTIVYAEQPELAPSD